MCISLFTGCSFLSRKPAGPPEIKYPKNLPHNEVVRVLSDRAVSVDSLWVSARVHISGSFSPRKTAFTATIIYKNPDMLRIRGYRAVASTLFDCLIKRDDVYFLSLKERVLYTGSVNDLANDSALPLKIDPRSFIECILVNNLIADAIAGDDFTPVKRFLPIGASRKYKTSHGEMSRVFYIGKKDLLPRKVVFRNNNTWGKVTYNHYELFEGVLFPSDITVKFSHSGYRVQLKISEIKLNPPKLSEKAFKMTVPEGFDIFQLGDATEK